MAELPPESLLAKLRAVLPTESFSERRLGRALAFQALYEADLTHHQSAQVMDRLTLATWQEAGELGYEHTLVSGALDYARELVQGVRDQRQGIDGLIQQRASAYPLAQMSAVDRNVLRIGLYESLFGNAKVPLKAAINEAVELAKLFGSETSARFVNGVLGRAIEASAARAETTAPDAIASMEAVAVNDSDQAAPHSASEPLSAGPAADPHQQQDKDYEGVL